MRNIYNFLDYSLRYNSPINIKILSFFISTNKFLNLLLIIFYLYKPFTIWCYIVQYATKINNEEEKLNIQMNQHNLHYNTFIHVENSIHNHTAFKQILKVHQTFQLEIIPFQKARISSIN